ncbi:MAG: DUF5674 family protein [Muribaculaceae bacterium]|nr:DUF5674 family protein [Roseburia sp.]MCM1492716.1 DUF5674 family protein [Muribaculaceae bacterium]
MVILDKKYTIKELCKINSFINGFVKGVVDLDKELVALDADMHYELADYLKEQRGSKESDMWGFNLWLENQSMDEILEYDSFINIHNNQMHGFPRGGMGILDPDIMEKATEVICKWIQF